MTTPKDNMHCNNPLCFDDECRGECEFPCDESQGRRLNHGDNEETALREFYCED